MRRNCPNCGAKIERIHRCRIDRLVAIFHPLYRYRCRSSACGWQGFLDREGIECPVWERRTLRFAVVSIIATVTIAAVYGIDRLGAVGPAERSTVAADARPNVVARLAPGETHDGTPLAQDDARAAADNRSPLQLRSGCAWGDPGRNPYRGTVAQAIAAAKLPVSVARAIEARIGRHAVTDRVYITRDAIRTMDLRRSFATKTTAMTFGTSLCFDTRVNFVPGHVEYADLYETVDEHGVRFSVMVPDVCGNVAVLAERAEEWPAFDESDDHAVGRPITIGSATAALRTVASATRQRH